MLVLLFPQNITLAKNCMNQLLVKRFIYFIPEIINVHLDDIGAGFEIDVPDLFGYFSLRNRTSLVPDKILHQGKFLRREFDPGAIAIKLFG